jgi:hypothetical protein
LKAALVDPKRTSDIKARRSASSTAKNHEGKGVQIVGEARPAHWRLKEAAHIRTQAQRFVEPSTAPVPSWSKRGWGQPMRTLGLLALLLLAVPLVGCQTDQEQMAAFKARADAVDDQTCRGYGAKPGTDIYIQCRMQRQQSRDAGDSAIAAAAASAPVINNPVPASDAPAIRPMVIPQTRCQSMRVGTSVQTVCN